MTITELLHVTAINPDLKGTGKGQILAELTDALLGAEPQLVRAEVLAVVQEREQLGSTGIGDGVAIPHGKLKELDRLLIAFGRHQRGVDFDSMDGKPAHLFFMLLAPEDSVGVHLKALARISKLLKNPAVRGRLLAATGAAEIYGVITEEEERL